MLKIHHCPNAKTLYAILNMRVILLLSFFIVASKAFPQKDNAINDGSYGNDSTISRFYFERHLSLVTGINVQKNLFGEFGMSIKDNGVAGHHPSTRILSLTTEFNFNRDLVIGPKVGIWLGGGSAGMNMGLNLIYYSNFNESTLRWRPEIGFGFDSFRVVYGYNFLITNKNADFINKHNFCLNVILNLKKIKEIRK